jgi:shikimate O-hydroxycinnamoyltransferase
MRTGLKSAVVVDKRLQSGAVGQPQYLTGFDIFSGHVGIPVILVYPQGFDLALFERSLVQTLQKYPVITGRMKKDAEGHQYIDCNDAGIDFRVHRCEGNTPPHGAGHPFDSKTIKQYYKPFMPWQVVGKDLALMQVDIHQFDDGGIVLCCHGVHSLFDGSAYWQFMLDWSGVCKGQEAEQHAMDRNAVIATAQQHPLPEGIPPGLMIKPTLGQMIPLFSRLGWRALTSMNKAVYRIPASTVERWKREAKAEFPEAAGVSTVELVTAHCLKVLSPLMTSPKDRCVGIVLDLRHKRRLKIPRDYFGNALGYGEARYSRTDVDQLSIAALANRCRPAPEHVTTEVLSNFMALMERFRGKRRIWQLFWRSAGETLDAGIILNNCIHFPIYQIDFGRGGPSWYDICGVAFRMLMVVQTPEMDGGVDLHLSARPKELLAFGESLKRL